MSSQLITCLLAVAANVVGILLLFSVASQFLARRAWRGRGTAALIVLVAITQLLWMPAAFLTAANNETFRVASYSLWFGNWLVTGFALILLGRTAGSIPKSLEDAAQLDGLGGLATWRQVVLPFVGRDLVLLAVFTIMATLLPYWAFINLPDASDSVVLFQRTDTPGEHLLLATIGSLVGAVPLLLIFVSAKPRR
jgi:ABC-type glycerol-3-phosphate transport system permease component